MKIRLALIALLAMFVFAGCGEDGPNSCSSCDDEPEANVSYNSSGQGVYKGIIVGSSGHIQINIENDGTTLSAVLVIDGKRYELKTDDIYSGGFEGEFYNDRNTETTEDDIRIEFNVNSDGSILSIGTIIIPGHDTGIEIKIYKELSSALVMGFEGTFSGDYAGVFNMVIRQNENGSGIWYAVSKRTAEPYEITLFQGELSETGVVMGSGTNTEITGEATGDNISGTWASGEISGTWKGRRTL